MDTPKDTNDTQRQVGNLTDFAIGVDKDNPLSIEVAVDDLGKVIVFHNKPFKCDIGWFEYDAQQSRLAFIMEEGEIRNMGMSLPPLISKNMQNSHQILTVLMDSETGDATEGRFIPLIIHTA